MLKINNTIYKNINNILLFTFVVGLFFSKAILSITTLIFFLWFILNKYNEITFKNNIQFAFLGLFLVYLFGAFWKTSQITDSINIIISKISILGLVFIYPILNLSNKQKKILFYFIISILFCISVYTLFLYASDQKYWNEVYSKGQVLPTFMHHVKYGLLIVLSINILVYSSITNKKLIYFIVLYFIIYLHLLAVKSGLIVLYLSIIIFVVQKIYHKKYQYLVVLIFPILFYFISPNLQNKINYLKYDIQQLNKENVLDYSDARRIISYQIALDIFKENKVFGVGLTNIKKITQEKYKAIYQYYDESKMMYVHNTYLHILASTGIIGFILFTISIILLLKNYWSNNHLLFLLNGLFLIVCFWDALTEQLVGLSIFILLQILGKKEQSIQ